MNKIIDGEKIANSILEDLKKKIKKEIGLAFILVGDNPASQTYIKMKKNACKRVGIQSYDFRFKETISENELIIEIDKLNKNKNIHGILVQMPLPTNLNAEKILESIDPNKDVDGFHPINVGKLLIGRKDCFIPCTPLGIKFLLEKENVDLEKKHTVIVGRSNIVGKPLLSLLIQKNCNATVTITHSMTKNLKEITKSADILIAAIGKPKFITKDMVKKDAIVIDVGVNKIIENDTEKIVGDVDFENVLPLASKITPVPKGVGPMTVAMLLKNTYKSFKNII